MKQDQTEIFCPHCGNKLKQGVRFCSRCGEPLGQPVVSSVQPAGPAPQHEALTHKLPDASKLPFAERPTVRLEQTTGFAALPVGAVVGTAANQRYEIRQVFDAKPGLNSYLAVDEQGQLCALFEAADTKQFDRERYLIEQRMSHSALVTLLSAFSEIPYEEQSRAYLVTEYPLAPITGLGTLAEIDALRWGAQLAEGLAFLHDRGLAHGNIQPASLIVSNNLVKLWNLATISQLSPELRDRDIYQLAYTLWHLATPPGQSAPTLSPAAALVFQREFSRDPKQRYQDARAFAADLQKAIDALRRPAGINIVVGRMTDVGIKRELNEDALLTIEAAEFIQTGNQVVGLYAVADGMGGAAAGEVASKMVTQTLARRVLSDLLTPRFAAQPAAEPDYGALLKSAAEQANTEIFRARQVARSDMGSTLVAALVVGNQAYVINIGDSRAYLIARGKIEQITEDHSLVWALVKRGDLSREDIYTHPQRNFILRNVGDKPQVQADLFTRALEPDQCLLLCSDGLWEMVRDPDLLRIVIENVANPQAACRALVEAANANGGDDNITCVLVRFESAQVKHET